MFLASQGLQVLKDRLGSPDQPVLRALPVLWGCRGLQAHSVVLRVRRELLELPVLLDRRALPAHSVVLQVRRGSLALPVLMEQREPPAPRVHPALPDQWVQLEYREQQDLLGHKDLLGLLALLVQGELLVLPVRGEGLVLPDQPGLEGSPGLKVRRGLRGSRDPLVHKGLLGSPVRKGLLGSPVRSVLQDQLGR